MEETTAVTVQNEFDRPAVIVAEGNLAIESSRATAEVLGAIHAAKRFPRDQFTAYNNILKECQRYTLAEKALYSYPRGGQNVTGPSIRMAEAIARHWGNIDSGIRELEQRDGESIMQSYAWDLETNFRVTKNFTVKHIRDKKTGAVALRDQRDIYELTANQGARRLRACLLAVVPGDVVEGAEKQVRQTLAAGPKGVTREDRVRKMVAEFDKLGVKTEHIEQRIGCPLISITDEQIIDLVGVYNAVKDGTTKRGDFFDMLAERSGAASKLNEKIKG